MKKKFLIIAIALVGFIAPTNSQNEIIDATSSTISWNAKKVTGEHYGKISIKSGTLTFTNEKISGGELIVDMTTITVEDLPAGEWHDKLIGHLKSDDFFSVDKFSESRLVITSTGDLDKNGDQELTAGLTIKGVTQMTNFKAFKTDSGYKTTLIIDRTRYGIKYGSGQFFEGLGDKMIEDTFTLEVNISVK